ncbi:MAG TPA: TIM barrel protein, partial [Candidatus Methylomirabilis sp.]|nr:TIM barrel protein [Candidatus Methylomirabilis sp.]
MRLGLSSFAYRYAIGGLVGSQAAPRRAVDVVSRAAALGLEVVQFCENLPLARLAGEEWEELLGVSRRLGVAIEVGTRGLEVSALLAHVDLAARAGSRALRLVLDATDPGVIIEVLRPVLERCQERHLLLAVENHFDLRSRQLVDLIRQLDDPWLGVCLDTANSIGHLEDPMETLGALGPYVAQVHLKDYAVEKAPLAYRIAGRILGQGWLDIPAVLKAVVATGRDPDLFLEQWMEPEKSLEATLAKERQWV